MSVSLDEVVTGLGLLGNVLSLPRQVQNQQIQNEQTRALLKDSGLPPEMITAATPEPMMRWLSPQQGGFTGHVLGGVGDVGSILSTVVGKPVKAPRVDLADLASASKLRTAHAQALAKEDLGRVIMDTKASKRDIAAAAIKAGSTDQALRLMRGDEGRPPASILGLRSTIESMDPTDPRLPAYRKALDDQLAWEKKRRDEENQAILDRQPKQYTPGERQQLTHEQIIKDRDKDAQNAGYKPGTDEYKYWMAFGHPPIAKAALTPEEALNKEIDKEQRRRDALTKNALTMDQIPDEPVEVTARRNLAAHQQAGAAQKAGTPLPPPAQTVGERAAADKAAKEAADKAAADKAAAEQGPGLGTRLYRGLFGGGETPTTTSTPSSTTTSTTQPPDTSDADAQAYIDSVDLSTLPPEVIQAAHAGMPTRQLANWVRFLKESPPQGPPAPPR